MYEKHINALTNARRCADAITENTGEIRVWVPVGTLEQCVALMRAAEPKDEAAEREHCRSAVAATAWETSSVPDLLMRERAAARAEVEAKYAKELELMGEMQCAIFNNAEIEARFIKEIERLKAELEAAENFEDELQAQLANLRAAAVKAANRLTSIGADEESAIGVSTQWLEEALNATEAPPQSQLQSEQGSVVAHPDQDARKTHSASASDGVVEAVRDVQLRWYEKREPFVRALVGAIEDRLGDNCPEWRALVSWEMDADAPVCSCGYPEQTKACHAQDSK